jgi:DNA-binding MarR family transcriptional regulator
LTSHEPSDLLAGMPESNVGTRTFTDPLALRALAHPLRLQLHALVGREGSLTAADAARQLGISHALASHHLRQLAKYGFVEEADAPDGRARPWRVTSTSFSVVPEDEEARSAEDVLQRISVEHAERDLVAWQERRATEDEAWAPLAGSRTGILYLTPAELQEALDAWTAIVVPLAARRPIGLHDERPADAVPVGYTLVTVPLERTEHGG